MTSDASTALGGTGDFGIGIIPSPTGASLSTIPTPRALLALSDDGHSVVGRQGSPFPGLPFHWRDGIFQLLPTLPAPAAGGIARAVSAEGAIVAGWSYAESGAEEAVLWHAGALQRLGALLGHDRSEVLALSADGQVAVGSSGSATASRAFRWDGAVLADLGPLTHTARDVSADGGIVVGDGPEGAFIWDVQHGTRRLADALLADHGLDVGAWQLDSATRVSADGTAFAGEGRDGEGQLRTWRVRLDETRCTDGPPIDLIAHQRAATLLERRTGLAVVDSERRVYVAGHLSRNVIRLDASFTTFPPPDAEEVLDLKDDGAPGDVQDFPFMLGVGPNDAVYVSAYARRQLMRIAPAGTREVVFDGSGYPDMESHMGPLPTAPLAVAFGENGAIFLLTPARLLRIDADGAVHPLIDAMEAGSLVIGAPTLLLDVAVQPGRVLVIFMNHLLVLDPESGSLLEAIDASAFGLGPILTGLSSDGRGRVWLSGGGVAVVEPDGSVLPIFEAGALPEETGLDDLSGHIGSLAAAPDGSAYYTDSYVLAHRAPDGTVTRLLERASPDVFGSPSGSFTGLHLSHGVLYWVGWAPDRVQRYRVAPPDCANGFDDDGDSAADYPADPGCASPDDEDEHSADLTCDNGEDDDGDGAIDFPTDASCASLTDTELPECSDGLDNDGDGAVDWDGAGVGAADPECGGDPMRVIEHPMYCGLGFEVALLLPVLAAWRRLRGRDR